MDEGALLASYEASCHGEGHAEQLEYQRLKAQQPCMYKTLACMTGISSRRMCLQQTVAVALAHWQRHSTGRDIPEES